MIPADLIKDCRELCRVPISSIPVPTYLEHEPKEAEIGALPPVPDMAPEDRRGIEEVIKDILWVVKLL